MDSAKQQFIAAIIGEIPDYTPVAVMKDFYRRVDEIEGEAFTPEYRRRVLKAYDIAWNKYGSLGRPSDD